MFVFCTSATDTTRNRSSSLSWDECNSFLHTFIYFLILYFHSLLCIVIIIIVIIIIIIVIKIYNAHLSRPSSLLSGINDAPIFCNNNNNLAHRLTADSGLTYGSCRIHTVDRDMHSHATSKRTQSENGPSTWWLLAVIIVPLLSYPVFNNWLIFRASFLFNLSVCLLLRLFNQVFSYDCELKKGLYSKCRLC